MAIRKNKFIINKNNVIIFIYFFIFFIQELIPNMLFFGQLINIFFGMTLVILLLINKIKFRFNTRFVQNCILVLIFLFFTFGSISFAYNYNGGPSLYLKVLSPLIVSAVIYYNGIDVTFMNKIYYTMTIIITIKWIIVGNENDVFNSSRNMISLYFLFMNCLDIFIRYKNNVKQDFTKVLLTLIFSFMAKGRSGIIISCLFLFVNIFHMGLKKGIRSKIRVALFMTILAILFYYSIDLIDIYLESFDRFGMETARIDYWQQYYLSLTNSILNFLFGTRLTLFYDLKIVDYNLHNAFLMAHANYGLFIFLFLFFTMIVGAFKALKRRNFSIIIIILVLMLKGNIDYVFFHSYCDILVFIIMFYILDLPKDINNYPQKERFVYEKNIK